MYARKAADGMYTVTFHTVCCLCTALQCSTHITLGVGLTVQATWSPGPAGVKYTRLRLHTCP